MLRDFKFSAVFQVGGDTGGTEGMTTDLRFNSRVAGAFLYHVVHVFLSQSMWGQLSGLAHVGFRGSHTPCKVLKHLILNGFSHGRRIGNDS